MVQIMSASQVGTFRDRENARQRFSDSITECEMQDFEVAAMRAHLPDFDPDEEDLLAGGERECTDCGSWKLPYHFEVCYDQITDPDAGTLQANAPVCVQCKLTWSNGFDHPRYDLARTAHLVKMSQTARRMDFGLKIRKALGHEVEGYSARWKDSEDVLRGERMRLLTRLGEVHRENNLLKDKLSDIQKCCARPSRNLEQKLRDISTVCMHTSSAYGGAHRPESWHEISVSASSVSASSHRAAPY